MVPPLVFAYQTFALDHQSLEFLPVSALLMISRLGSVMAAIFFANAIIRRINFYSFYLKADASYFVPDLSTRKIIVDFRRGHMKGRAVRWMLEPT